MNAGELRHFVTIQQPGHTYNDAREIVAGGWTTLAQTWAGIRPLKAWEIERARQVQMRTTHEVKLRYDPDIAADLTPGCRITHGDLTLDITGIVNVEMRNIEWLLTCQEVTQP